MTTSSARQRQHGLSLLEFVLIALMISVLIVLAFQRIAALRVDMERAAIEHTVGSIRSALALQLVAAVTGDETERAGDLAGANALRFLSPRPPSVVAPRPRSAAPPPPGSWYFESDSGTVAYRPRYPDQLGRGDILRWRVVPERGSDNGAITALAFRPVSDP